MFLCAVLVSNLSVPKWGWVGITQQNTDHGKAHLSSRYSIYILILWNGHIEDIYFFEVNTKYISSSAVKKISIFHECVARVKMLIFSPHEMEYILYLP